MTSELQPEGARRGLRARGAPFRDWHAVCNRVLGMRFEAIQRRVLGVPFIGVVNARLLYDLIVREHLTRVLELGVAHGTATCYMAAALDELGTGRITAVDLKSSQKSYDPAPEEQLRDTGLWGYVTVVRTQTGYPWFLHDEIRRCTHHDSCHPEYDLCIIDGSKNWTIDGCAFFLADKLLRPGGFMIFDDYSWTYAMANKRRAATDGVSHRELSEAELSTPHVREIFELLVKQHPDYSNFDVYPIGDWAIARKVRADEKSYTVHYDAEPRHTRAMLHEGVMRVVRSAAFRRPLRHLLRGCCLGS